jgi:hypothetical protein
VPTTAPASVQGTISVCLRDRARRGDQREVAERLGEVAEELPRARLDLLGIEADVVCQSDELVHERGGLVDPSRLGEGLDEPERAGQECALLPWKSVLALVAEDKRPIGELAANRVDGRVRPLVVVAADKGGHQQRRVELAGTGPTDVAAPFLRPAALVEEALDRAGRLAPAGHVVARNVLAGERDRAVEGDPAHELRVGEVHRLAAHLPDPGVGPAPHLADEVGDLRDAPGSVAVESMAALDEQPYALEQAPVDAELELVGRAVAYPDRPRAAVA